MKKFKTFLLLSISFLGLLFIWNWIDNKDYFNSEYYDLKNEEVKIFKWNEGDNENSVQERYRQHFTNREFTFPRQKVFKVKLFVNTPIIGIFTARTLKENKIGKFVNICNDTSNYSWGETTWQISQSEYYFKLYNDKSNAIGKIYFCLDKCGMASSRPFCPAMKFGGLSDKGQEQIKKLINDKTNWD